VGASTGTVISDIEVLGDNIVLNIRHSYAGTVKKNRRGAIMAAILIRVIWTFFLAQIQLGPWGILLSLSVDLSNDLFPFLSNESRVRDHTECCLMFIGGGGD
jgi:hypothetical protein